MLYQIALHTQKCLQNHGDSPTLPQLFLTKRRHPPYFESLDVVL